MRKRNIRKGTNTKRPRQKGNKKANINKTIMADTHNCMF
jgi:hypothetical protein